MRGQVIWSIYVKTSSMRTLLQKHVPPIEAALERDIPPEAISREPENPNEYRLFLAQKFSGRTAQSLIVPVLRRAYRLSESWNIQGLDDIEANQLRYVVGHWRAKAPSSCAPAITDMLFELAPLPARPRAERTT